MCLYWPLFGRGAAATAEPEPEPVVDDELDRRLRDLVMEPLPIQIQIAAREDRPPRQRIVRC